MLSKIFMGTTAIATIACVWLYIQLQAAQIQLANQQTEIVNVTNVKNALQDSNTLQGDTIRTLSDLATTNAQELTELSQTLQQSRGETENAQVEITKLRLTEQENALAQPFARGNASSARVRDHLLRAVGGTGSP